MAVCVRSEAVCDQTCFRELHTACWSAIGAEEILEGCGIRMVPQDQKASAVSLTKFNHCLNVFPPRFSDHLITSLTFSPSICPSSHVSSAPSLIPFCKEKKQVVLTPVITDSMPYTCKKESAVWYWIY